MRHVLTALTAMLLVLGPVVSHAQTGVLTGKVVEPDTRVPVRGATVTVQGADIEAITDGGGNYSLELEPGTYTLEIEAGDDYETRTVTGVTVSADETAERNLTLARAATGGEDTAEFGEFTVEAGYLEGSPASVITTRRDAIAVSEVIGSDQMEAAGDGDAAEALQRVTGLTIQDDKFVVVRGQPARYTLTLWNGSQVPSPDPLKRIVPLDLFPTGVLSSVQVQKAYSADKPGAFGGGLIELETRGVPEEGFLEASVGLGFQSESTGEDGLGYDGGDRDFLGMDDGTRELPGEVARATAGGQDLNQLPESERNELGRTFPNIYNVDSESLPLDRSLGISGGKRFEALGGDVGILGTFGWSQSFRLREETRRTYALAGDSLRVANDFDYTQSDMNVDLGGLFVVRGEWDNTRLTSNTFLIRKTTDRVTLEDGIDSASDVARVRNFELAWNERQMLVQQFTGAHKLDFANLDWRLMTAEGDRESPDRRSYSYTAGATGGDFVFDAQTVAERRYNDVQDSVDELAADLSIPLLDDDTWELSAKTGFSLYSQDRSSTTRRFTFDPQSSSSAPPEEILAPENIGDTVAFEEATRENDAYTGTADVNAVYGMADVKWQDTVRAVVGLRSESADFRVETFQQGGAGESIQAVGDFETDDLLPSLNVTWFATDDTRVRASFTRSVSRPTLNELSPATYFDPDTNEIFQGNPDLQPAEIDGFDLRWAWYPTPAEQFSVGFFTKAYTNPIERVLRQRGDNDILNSWANADEATVTGVETSVRANLQRLDRLFETPDFVENMYLQGNLSLIDSEVTLARPGIATNSERPLQGQADTVLNLRLGYDGSRNDWTVALNRVGERLWRPGVRGKPDILQQPELTLDATWSYSVSDSMEVKTELGNILGEETEITQGGRTFREYEQGQTANVSLKWRFW